MKWFLLIALIGLVGCSHCKKGQIELGGECYYPGHTYLTDIYGNVIRD